MYLRAFGWFFTVVGEEGLCLDVLDILFVRSTESRLTFCRGITVISTVRQL